MNSPLVIFNPAANSARAKRLRKKIFALVGDAEIALTSAPGEARALAEKAANDGVQTIVAAGGDGTINEIVNGIANREVTLGLLPIGTMNVFAAELGIPANKLEECWRIIANGHTRRIDLARANDRYFAQMGGVGFDAQVVKETPREWKKNIGPLSYAILATQIAARKPPLISIESDEKNCDGSFVLIGNGRFYGGPIPIFKEARIDDGLLDVLVFQNLGHLDLLRYMQGIAFGKHLKMNDVVYFQTRRLAVRSEEEVAVEVDGEWIGSLPADFEIVPSALQVLAPPILKND